MAAIDVLAEDLVQLSELAKTLPHHPSPAVLWRWQRTGSNNTTLATIKVAGRVYTTRTEFRRFIAAIQKPTSVAQAENDAVEAHLAECGYSQSKRTAVKQTRGDHEE